MIGTYLLGFGTVVDYGQLVRGVGMNIGTHTGILDLKGMAKIATGKQTSSSRSFSPFLT